MLLADGHRDVPLAGGPGIDVGASDGGAARAQELHPIHALAPADGGEARVQDPAGCVAPRGYGPQARHRADLGAGVGEVDVDRIG